jgi:hypothetical protein
VRAQEVTAVLFGVIQVTQPKCASATHLFERKQHKTQTNAQKQDEHQRGTSAVQEPVG